jgi:tryptophan synthase beta subunit
MGGSQSKTTNTDAHLDNSSALKTSLPAPDGYFGDEKKYGGAYLPPPLEPVMKAVFDAYMQIKVDPAFLSELTRLRKEFIGRPSPIFHCKNLSDKYGGAQIYLKRRSMVIVPCSPGGHPTLSPPACSVAD